MKVSIRLTGALLFFLLIPLVTYSFCHSPYIIKKGIISFFRLEHNLLFYHFNLGNDANSSPWWSWILIIKPILMYKDILEVGAERYCDSLVLMGNPWFWWVSIPCILGIFYQAIRERREFALLVTGLFFCEALFWSLSPRLGYIYYLLNSLPAMALAVTYYLESLWSRKKAGKLLVVLFLAGVVISLIYFYPILIGIPVPEEQCSSYQWLRSWKF